MIVFSRHEFATKVIKPFLISKSYQQKDFQYIEYPFF